MRALKFAIPLAAALLSACASGQFVVELGAGHDRNASVGRNPQSVARLRFEPRDGASGWVYEYNHHSSIRDGYPFNDNDDDLVDQYSVIYRWVF